MKTTTKDNETVYYSSQGLVPSSRLHEYRSITGNKKFWESKKNKAGGGNTRGKTTIDQVREIRRLAADGMMNVEIAELYDLSDQSVGRIVRGTTWGDVV